MFRYFAQLSFKGTNYHGWQIQPNAVSVQQILENVLSTVLQEKVSVTGAGRTDAGVHASFFVMHFDLSERIVDFGKLIYKLNGFLPNDISVKRIWEVPDFAHARFSAVSRTYNYYVVTEKNPFKTETALYYNSVLDIERMNEAAKVLFDYSDFTSFSRLHSDVKTNNCKIYKAEWTKNGTELVFTIKADRFLRNMVRAVVGTLLEAGRGKLSSEGFKEIIEAKNRGAAGASAAAHALFLVDIEYPQEIMKYLLD